MSDPVMLYHYTSYEAFLKIFETNTLWATSAPHVNDSSEFQRLGDLLDDVCLAHDFDREDDFVTFVRDAAIELSTTRSVNLFDCMCSLSSDGDSLSQWRAYTPQSGGVAIGVEFATLDAVPNSFLLQCVYDVSKQREQLRDALAAHFTRVEQAKTQDEYDEALNDSMVDYLVMRSQFKHPAFRDEQEWRLVVHRTPAAKFRVGRTGIMPYHEIPFDGMPKLVSEVVVGPCPHPREQLRALELLREVSREKGFSIVTSAIPFRSW